MEFNETLQELRRQKGLTQEELANALFVSRTAISKWESGRGFPNIDSLKAIARFFDVSLDDLLSGETILAIAEDEHKRARSSAQDLMFGLLDCAAALLFFLPLFGQQEGGIIREVSLLALTAVQPYMKAAFVALVIAINLWGVLTLALQNCRSVFWVNIKHPVSIALGAVGMILFVLSQQPYAAVFTFVLLIIKALTALKRR